MKLNDLKTNEIKEEIGVRYQHIVCNNYIINRNTMFLIPIGDKCSEVHEKTRSFQVNKKPLDIIKDSCCAYGSTYEGRLAAARIITQKEYKLAITVIDNGNTSSIFFPTASPNKKDCCWLHPYFLNYFTFYENDTLVNFTNGNSYLFEIAEESIEKQIYKYYILEKHN